MKAWNYREHVNPNVIDNSPFVWKCRYCENEMEHQEVEDIWPISADTFISNFRSTRKEYKKWHDLDDVYLDLKSNSLCEEKPLFVKCTVCGWWQIHKEVKMCAEAWQIWQSFYGRVGVLKNLNLSNQFIPLNEIRSYLAARYSHRFYVHPRLFEEVVSDVYRSIGFANYITNYSNDGGIDIVMQGKSDEMIGVQVKRYRNSIKVEQIRSFLGALIINNMAKGVFVTTSNFHTGCYKVEDSYPISLINGTNFYEALKDAQLNNKEYEIDISLETIPKLNCFFTVPMNSL